MLAPRNRNGEGRSETPPARTCILGVRHLQQQQQSLGELPHRSTRTVSGPKGAKRNIMLQQFVSFSSLSLWLVRGIVKAYSSAPAVLLPDAGRGAIMAIILIDALIVGLACVVYTASSLGLLPSPILDLAKPFF